MGLVTRSSTSFALAPGMLTKMSIMGTMIWGSSSRGKGIESPNPRRMEARMMRGVSLESMKNRAIFPAAPASGSWLDLHPGAVRELRVPARATKRSPVSSPERTSTFSSKALPSLIRRKRAMPWASRTNRAGELPLMDHRFGGIRASCAVRPRGTSTRANIPDFTGRSLGRETLTRKERVR